MTTDLRISVGAARSTQCGLAFCSFCSRVCCIKIFLPNKAILPGASDAPAAREAVDLFEGFVTAMDISWLSFTGGTVYVDGGYNIRG